MDYLDQNGKIIPPAELRKIAVREAKERELKEEAEIMVAKRMGTIDEDGNAVEAEPEEVEEGGNGTVEPDLEPTRCHEFLVIIVAGVEDEGRCVGRVGHPGAHRIVIEFQGG